MPCAFVALLIVVAAPAPAAPPAGAPAPPPATAAPPAATAAAPAAATPAAAPAAPAAAGALTLDDALRTALDRRPDLRAGRERVAARRKAADAAWAPFVPHLTTRVAGDESRAPIAGPFDSFFQRDDTISTQSLGAGLALGGWLPTGTSWELGADGQVAAYTYYAEALNPRFEPSVHMKLTQHLWRELGPSANLADVNAADADASLEEAVAAAQEQTVAQEVADAWLAASRAAAVVTQREKSVELAEQFEVLTRQLIEGGSLSRLDLALALQTVSGRKAELAAAVADRDLAMSRLGEALGGAPDDGKGKTPVLALAPIADAPSTVPSLDEVLQQARAVSPQIRAAHAARDRALAVLPARQDPWKPDVRLVVGGSVSGVAGTTTCKSGFLRDGITPCHVPAAYEGGADRALANLEAGQIYAVGVALEGDMPVLFGASLASGDAGAYDVRAAELDVERAGERVAWQARSVVQDVKQRAALLAAATENVKLAEDALTAEDAKLRGGRSTGFALLRAQEIRVGAAIQETEARYQLAAARVRLDVLTGKLGPAAAAAN